MTAADASVTIDYARVTPAISDIDWGTAAAEGIMADMVHRYDMTILFC